MVWIESTLKRWHTHLEARLRALDQPSVTIRFSSPLPPFSPEDKQALLVWVRQRVEHHLSVSTTPLAPLALPGSFPPINLDVAFWVRGEIRASAILAENLPLALALERCTERALHDGRFRPLDKSELSELRIELTFFGPWESLQRDNVERFPIHPDHGYVATLGGLPRAWYLPMVHNALRFDTLADFIQSLLTEKGGLSRAEAARANLYHFPTLGFLESSEKSALDLVGPLVAGPVVANPDALLETSLAWLLRQEIVPGFFLPKHVVGKIDTRTIDWVRVGFAAATLAEAGQALVRADCVAAAERGVAFLERELEPALFIGREAKALAAIYAGLAAHQLGHPDQAKRWLGVAERVIEFENLTRIATLLGGKLLAWTGETERARAIFERQYEAWHVERKQTQLATYPELVPLALALFEKTREDSFREKAETVGDWYAAQQLTDGSFPFAPGAPRAPYLRGSGKILEILACLPERYEETITRGFRFATSLQYTEDSSYHVPHAQLAEFLGGFRHDVFNREAWIDAAGHVIFALVRVRAKNRER